jgi:hypothetical protein
MLSLRRFLAPSLPLTHKPARSPTRSLPFSFCVAPSLPSPRFLAPANSHTRPPTSSLALILPLRSSLAPSPLLSHTPARPPARPLQFSLCVAAPLLHHPRSITGPPARRPDLMLPLHSSLAASPPFKQTHARPPARTLPCPLCVASSLPLPRSLTHPPTRPPASILPLRNSLAPLPPRTHTPTCPLARFHSPSA